MVRPANRKAWILVATAILVPLAIALAAVTLHGDWLQGISGKPHRLEPPPPPPEPECVLELVDAVNEYYEKEGEYPPYLLGGLAEDWGLVLVGDYQLKDPLIESGILSGYPEVQKWRDRQRLIAPIQNIVSSPNDPLVVYLRDKYTGEALTEARRLEAEGQVGNLSPFPEGTDLAFEIHRALSYERFLCGGGGCSIHMRAGSERVVHYRTSEFVDGISQVIQLAKGWLSVMFFTIDSEFGYQRGEYVGEDKRSCWLWFYADEPVLTNYLGEPDKPDMWIVGLDLVDADDGLIQPDGIPDGIVLLYKLKEGKVVEVVKDYD